MKINVDKQLGSFPLSAEEIGTVFSFVPDQLADQIISVTISPTAAASLCHVGLCVDIGGGKHDLEFTVDTETHHASPVTMNSASRAACGVRQRSAALAYSTMSPKRHVAFMLLHEVSRLFYFGNQSASDEELARRSEERWCDDFAWRRVALIPFAESRP